MTDEERDRIKLVEVLQVQVYCPEIKKLDMENRRVTDIKTNMRVMMPDPLSTKQEAILIIRRLLETTESS